jgi:hypothetical protein
MYVGLGEAAAPLDFEKQYFSVICPPENFFASPSLIVWLILLRKKYLISYIMK